MFTQNGLLSSHLINSILKSLISVGVFKDNFRKFPLLISGHISFEMIEFISTFCMQEALNALFGSKGALFALNL